MRRRAGTSTVARGPSFDALLRQARTWPPEHPAWTYDRKLAGRELASRLGLRVPELLSGPGTLRELTPPGQAAVLKPDAGSTGRGVFLLVPDGADYRLADGTVAAWDRVVALARKATRAAATARLHSRVQPPWLVEAAVADHPVVTYRCFTFACGVELVLGGFNPTVAGGDRLLNAWDPTAGWRQTRPLATTRARVDTSITPPRFGAQMLEAACRVREAVGVPFLRVDFYEDDHGPLFGEITPVPTWGSNRHTPQWDRRLGAAWVSS